MKRLFTLLIIGFVCTAGAFAQVDAPVPDGQVQIIDNFENGNYWIWAGFDYDKYGDHKISCGADLSKTGITEGKYAMELKLEPTGPGKGALWFYDGSQDLSGGNYIVADFYNPSPITHVVTFVIQATDGWNWNQAEMYNIEPGHHTVVWYVGDMNKDFKETKRISIMSYYWQQFNEESSLYVDNIRLIK